MTRNCRIFIDRVNELLGDVCRIHSGTIGRSEKDGLVWVLGITLPNQRVTTVHAPIADDASYLESTAQDVATRLQAYLKKLGETMATKKTSIKANTNMTEEQEKAGELLKQAEANVAHAATMLVPSVVKFTSTQYVVEAEDWDAFKEVYDAWHEAGADFIKLVRKTG